MVGGIDRCRQRRHGDRRRCRRQCRWLRGHAAGIDPLAFGAAGDGVSDNYDAIQAAFDSAWVVGGNTVRHHDTRLLKICFGRTETPPPLLIPSHIRVEIDAVIQVPADYDGLAGGPVLLSRGPEAGIGILGRLAVDCNGAPDLAGMAGRSTVMSTWTSWS